MHMHHYLNTLYTNHLEAAFFEACHDDPRWIQCQSLSGSALSRNFARGARLPNASNTDLDGLARLSAKLNPQVATSCHDLHTGKWLRLNEALLDNEVWILSLYLNRYLFIWNHWGISAGGWLNCSNALQLNHSHLAAGSISPGVEFLWESRVLPSTGVHGVRQGWGPRRPRMCLDSKHFQTLSIFQYLSAPWHDMARGGYLQPQKTWCETSWMFSGFSGTSETGCQKSVVKVGRAGNSWQVNARPMPYFTVAQGLLSVKGGQKWADVDHCRSVFIDV